MYLIHNGDCYTSKFFIFCLLWNNLTNFNLFQGDYIWIEPQSKKEFDVAIGARVIAAEGRRIQITDDDENVRGNYIEWKWYNLKLY